MSSYCTPADVAALNKARKLGQGNNPTEADVLVYIELTAAEIDSILVGKGYNVPIPSSYPEAFQFCRWLNSKAALVMMEESSPNSTILATATKSWEEARAALVAARDIMEVPMDTPRVQARGPGVTEPTLKFNRGEVYDPTNAAISRLNNNPQAPYLSRTLEF